MGNAMCRTASSRPPAHAQARGAPRRGAPEDRVPRGAAPRAVGGMRLPLGPRGAAWEGSGGVELGGLRKHRGAHLSSPPPHGLPEAVSRSFELCSSWTSHRTWQRRAVGEVRVGFEFVRQAFARPRGNSCCVARPLSPGWFARLGRRRVSSYRAEDGVG